MTNQHASRPPDDSADATAHPDSTAPGPERDEPDQEANPDDEDAGLDPMGAGEGDVDPDDDRAEDYT